MAAMGFCMGMLHVLSVEKRSADIQVVLYWIQFYFLLSLFSLLVPMYEKKIRHHIVDVILLSTALIRYLNGSLNYGSNYAKELLSYLP